jgi:hypothetical protein
LTIREVFMLLAELLALAIMTSLGTLIASDTGPGRAVIYAIQCRRRRRRLIDAGLTEGRAQRRPALLGGARSV